MTGSSGHAREEQQLSRASSGARRLPPNSGGSLSRLPAQNLELMERKLREALDSASFQRAVVRIENGVYDFGPSVRAVVKLSADDEVVACRKDSGDPFEPISDFIRAVAQEGQRPQPMMDRAGEDQGILGEMLPPPPRTSMGGASAGTLDPLLSNRIAEPSRKLSDPEREPVSQAGRTSPLPQPVPALMAQPVRSPRTHWQPQAAQAANTSPPRGATTATPPPQRSSSGRQGPPVPQLGASLRSCRQMSDPGASNASVPGQARTSTGGPPVPPLQLHTAAMAAVLNGRAMASSTPERPRAGQPPVPPAPLGAPLVSPRPQAAQGGQQQQQKQQATRQMAPSPPRVIRGPAAAPGPAARVAMTQSPRRQFAM